MLGSVGYCSSTTGVKEDTGSVTWLMNGVVPVTTLKYLSTRLTVIVVVTPAVSVAGVLTLRPPVVGLLSYGALPGNAVWPCAITCSFCGAAHHTVAGLGV